MRCPRPVVQESEIAGKQAYQEAEANILEREARKFEKAEQVRQEEEEDWLKQRENKRKRVQERRKKQERKDR